MTAEHAEAAGELPLFHRDPFDRMLIAQAQVEGLVLATRDTAMARYGIRILKAKVRSDRVASLASGAKAPRIDMPFTAWMEACPFEGGLARMVP
jgi:hypothetical protein